MIASFWAEFLSGFNLLIFYTSCRKNRKADSHTHRPNNCPANHHNNQQQYLLQTIVLPERLEISSIDSDQSEILSEKVI